MVTINAPDVLHDINNFEFDDNIFKGNAQDTLSNVISTFKTCSVLMVPTADTVNYIPLNLGDNMMKRNL